MPVTLETLSPGPSTEMQRMRIFNPDGSTNQDVAMAWSSADGGFIPSAPVSLLDGGPYEGLVRKVTAQTGAAFDASTTNRLYGEPYFTIGYVVNGVLVDDDLVGLPVAGQSAFELAFAANLDPLYVLFGVAGSYAAPDGTSVAGLTLRVRRDDPHQVERPNRAIGEMQTGQILVRQSELARPVKNGRFTVRGVEVWTIETTPRLQHGEYICTCTRTGVEIMMPRRQNA